MDKRTGLSYSEIIANHYGRNWRKFHNKRQVVARAVVAYMAATDTDPKGINIHFAMPANPECGEEQLHFQEMWVRKVDQFFNPDKTVRMPSEFLFYLVAALDEPFRDECLRDLSALGARILATPAIRRERDLANAALRSVRENGEASAAAAQLILDQGDTLALVACRNELQDSIDADQHLLEEINRKLGRDGL